VTRDSMSSSGLSSQLRETLLFVGFFTAHGVLSVSTGETLIPILGYQSSGRKKILERLEGDDYKQVVDEGRALLESNPERYDRMVLVFDGYIDLPSGRTDAVFVEARSYFPLVSFSLAIPYRNANRAEGFAVHRPKLLSWPESEPVEVVARWLQDGIASHAEANEVWSRHLDESL